MGAVNKALVLNHITEAFRKEFSAGLALHESQWQQVAMEIPSTTKTNTYGFLGKFPKMREWVGKRQIDSMNAQGTSITNKKYQSTVGIPREEIEDDQVGLYMPMMKLAGQSAAELPDDEVFGLLKKGKTTLCYDGQNFFDNDHPVYEKTDGTGSHTTQSNLTVGTDQDAPTFYILDTRLPIKPLIWQKRTAPEIEVKFDPSKSEHVFMEDEYLWGVRARGAAGFGFWQLIHRVEKTNLTAENVKKVIQNMEALKGDGGKVLNIRPNLILVPTALKYKAKELFETKVINGTSNILEGDLKVLVSPFINE
ncbi:Mu-like prophage major head subunit gpT family protein [Pasteurella multocida subsp. multocida]|uniref:Mu-like prophage major head subunit gpT family protein n=1 Tax=Pasteurella multocida TaxID=747 RepID=UPI000868437D|nr:Mu-like prophage major head subunit gpT family protein [Pasteurella multocida]MBF6981445.1 Mu-like prophage major head subunit gpT family protein [Pasteurella multocida]MDA5619124.1 Mu-like prophage major head subunit gpT family protein [Pasteurella multocida subsp. multocida]MDA5621604.1 Mu-like prophage major head subunit gpT family protein [Pasteurella multocida subsp. multocida]ODS43306.1 head protein [Pasteurella multocida]